MLPVNAAGVDPEQIVCGALAVLFVIVVFTVIVTDGVFAVAHTPL